jgi:hypothetical protein
MEKLGDEISVTSGQEEFIGKVNGSIRAWHANL